VLKNWLELSRAFDFEGNVVIYHQHVRDALHVGLHCEDTSPVSVISEDDILEPGWVLGYSR